MKKLVTLLAAAGMVTAAAAPASAVDVKVDYRHRVSFTSTSENFDGTNLEQIKNRVRLGLTFAASENLKGYVQFQLLQNELMGQSGGVHGSNDTEVRQMYMDWKVPGTPVSVRMGRMEMGLPADAFGENAVMAAGFGSRDGVVVTAPVADWLTLTALWNRANYAQWVDPTDSTVKTHDLDKNTSDDVYAAVAGLKFDGVKADVYAAYATLDGGPSAAKKNCGTTLPKFEGDAYWIGFTSTWSFFDPFTLKLSAAYGAATADKYDVRDTKGWNVQAKASYKTAYGTPVLGAWYFSGDDKDELGTMPSVQGAFTPIRMYHDASTGLNGGTGYENPVGTWGIQAGIEKVSFVKDLSHGFWVSYVEGTNDQDCVTTSKKSDYLGEEDSFVAFNLSNTYKIYKNLSASLELYYMISDFETKARDLSEDDYGFELTFEYKF